MKRILALCSIVLVVAALPLFSFGSREKKPDPVPAPDWATVQEGERVVLTGKIRLVGSAAANSLVLTDLSGKDWYIDDAEREILSRMEQREATLSAVIRLDPIKFADGTELPDRRVLTGITVVK